VLSHLPNLEECIQEFARVQTKPGNCLISAFHPDTIVTAHWRTSLQETDAIYRLPNNSHTRDDYMNALTGAGYKIKQVIDLRVEDVPEGYFPPAMITEHGNKGFCLIVLAQLA
jgi:hypothetical protein